MLVQQILNSKANDHIIAVTPRTNVLEAAIVLAKYKIGTVVISEDGKKSQRNFIRARYRACDFPS